MLRKFFRKFFHPQTKVPGSIVNLQIIPQEKHGITRNKINPCALKITTGLQQAGYSAFIVGGAVRDLLLELKPKDYDVATSATPEEVRAVFRRSRIIGRRFRLVHVMCGAETVEVSTFRGHAESSTSNTQTTRRIDKHGRLLRDNVFGNQEEDAMRRDFTINALFYDPDKEEIHDFLDGYNDIKKKCLRIIGSPEKRYREDPIRMLRAVRLAAKLEIQIDDVTAAPIGSLAPLLKNVPSARLLDEILKLLFSGHAYACVTALRARGLHHGLLPMLDVVLEQPLGKRFITLALKNTDKRIQQQMTVSPGFLFAALLWHEVLTAWNLHQASGEKPIPALNQATNEILALQHKKLAIPKRLYTMITEIWAMQPRFQARAGRKPFRLLTAICFRAAYDFMLLRCESGELDPAIGQWWKEFKNADADKRETLLLKDVPAKKKRKRRSRNKLISKAADNQQITVEIKQ